MTAQNSNTAGNGNEGIGMEKPLVMEESHGDPKEKEDNEGAEYGITHKAQVPQNEGGGKGDKIAENIGNRL